MPPSARHRNHSDTPVVSLQMHRFWTIRELVEMVFRAFTRNKKDLSALASAAQVSRLLSDPALDVLWAHLETAKPLCDGISISRNDFGEFMVSRP